MNTKHTAGPWRFFKDTRFGPWNTVENKQGNPHYYQWWIESDTRKLMALLEVPYLAKGVGHSVATKAEHRKTLKEVEANAHLIVAAPDLLKACKRLLRLHRDTAKPSLEGLEATNEADAAIAKAKGPK